MIEICVDVFKAQCLKLIDLIEQNHEIIVITKQGTPIAKLIPYEEKSKKLFGFLKGSVIVNGDVVGPIEESWDT